MKDLHAEFDKFDSENPRIWELFERFTERAIARGFKNLSADMVVHRIRWEVYVETVSADDYKINNNHVAYYARKWLEKHPEHAKFFELRKVRGESDNGHSFGEDGQGNLFT